MLLLKVVEAGVVAKWLEPTFASQSLCDQGFPPRRFVFCLLCAVCLSGSLAGLSDGLDLCKLMVLSFTIVGSVALYSKLYFRGADYLLNVVRFIGCAGAFCWDV